jgi:hypothetical protein
MMHDIQNNEREKCLFNVAVKCETYAVSMADKLNVSLKCCGIILTTKTVALFEKFVPFSLFLSQIHMD